jgi:1,2-dihydroxy-3-keto-5-methylthiopentene dioxygenase
MSSGLKTTYSLAASWFHWAVAVPMIGCVGTVLKAQQAPKEEKGIWMFRHKSLGLLTGMIVAPRVAYRVASSAGYKVMGLPGSAVWEQQAAGLGHYALYGFMTVMPTTGILMGYYGGKGLPFFTRTLPGAAPPASDDEKKRNGSIAKRSFQLHKQLGVYGKYLIPVHAGAAVMHYARGQAIFRRINPFRSPRA